MSIIAQLASIQHSSTIGCCIRAMASKPDANELLLVKEIREMARDNYRVMEEVLGAPLLNKIINYKPTQTFGQLMKRFAMQVLETMLLIILAFFAFFFLLLWSYAWKYIKDVWVGIKQVWAKGKQTRTVDEIDWYAQNARV